MSSAASANSELAQDNDLSLLAIPPPRSSTSALRGRNDQVWAGAEPTQLNMRWSGVGTQEILNAPHYPVDRPPCSKQWVKCEIGQQLHRRNSVRSHVAVTLTTNVTAARMAKGQTAQQTRNYATAQPQHQGDVAGCHKTPPRSRHQQPNSSIGSSQKEAPPEVAAPPSGVKVSAGKCPNTVVVAHLSPTYSQ